MTKIPLPKTPLNTVGRLPWRKHDVVRHFADGHTELVRWAILDADNREVARDFTTEEARDAIVAAVNLYRSAICDSLMPPESYLDPMSIFLDAREILPIVLDEREAYGHKDDILRDLLRRVKKVTAAATGGKH